MLEFVQALHEAFRTESRWLFVLYIGLMFGMAAACIAYVVDSGYQRKLKESKATLPAAPTPIIIKDTVEEDRLRAEVEQLKRRLDEREQHRKNRQRVGEFLAKGNKIKAACDSLGVRPDLEQEAERWAEETLKGLAAIDASYAARFEGASGDYYGRSVANQPVPGINNNVWNWVNVRTGALTRILETMPN